MRLFSVAVTCTLCVVSLVFFFFCNYVSVQGASMTPTYATDDVLVYETLSHRLGLLARGDVVVIREPRTKEHPLIIKRIVGLPGETVRVRDEYIEIEYPDKSTERFEKGSEIGRLNNGSPKEMFLGPEDYYVLGDNRDLSTDSRTWGSIQPHEMLGKVMVTIYQPVRH